MKSPRVPRLLHDALLVSAERAPDDVAVAGPEGRIRYGALLERTLELAGALQSRGLARGDRVAILLDNGVPAIVAVYATLIAGGAFVIVHPHTRAEKLRFLLHDCGASALITDASGATRASSLRSRLPALKTVIAVDDGVAPNGHAVAAGQPVPPDAIAWRDLEADAAPPRLVGTIPLDLAALIYTSGSTGRPKGVMLSHQAMTFTQGSLVEYLRLDQDDRVLNVLPLAFDYGLYQAFMAVRLGARLVLERSFGFPAQVVRRMQEERVTVLPGVPTVFAALLSLHRRAPYELPDVRRITNTAAHLPDAHVSRLHELCPDALIYRMYGLTECKRVSYLEPELALEKPASVGKAIPGTEAFILDERGRRAEPGVPGILYVRGPHVMMGYWNRPDETDRMLVPGPWPGERMLCTHDLFATDEDGYLYFVGRTDDIIKSGGEKISPLEVENALHAVPGVREAAVVGVADPVLGQAVRAYVVVDEGSDLSDQAVKQGVSSLLEPMLVPRDVQIVADLPRTGSGKVRKRDLRDLEPARVSGEATSSRASARRPTATSAARKDE